MLEDFVWLLITKLESKEYVPRKLYWTELHYSLSNANVKHSC